MASNHPHFHHCTTTSAVCCCCTPSRHLPPLPDPHSLHHHHHHPPPSPPPTNLYSPYPHGPNPNPPYTTTQNHHHRHQQLWYTPPPADLEKERCFHQLHHGQQTELTNTRSTLSSLLCRIAVLESSLRHHSSSHSHSLRDAAARTIQTHFRAFLVRRSRTLRQLKELASIKSNLNILKSSVSENPRFDSQFIARKALNLLFKLDSIQGDDPMIRDGKRSISVQLTRFLDLIDGVTLKKSEISARLVKKNFTKKCGALYNDQKRGDAGCRNLARNTRLEDLIDRIDALSTKVTKEEDDVEDEENLEIPCISRDRTARLGKRDDGVGNKVKKRVSFMENGKVYKVHRSLYEPILEDCDSVGDDSDSVDDQGKFEEKVPTQAEEVGSISFKENEDDENSQDGESTKSSDNEGRMYELRNGDGGITFSAPLPVKMEARTDMMDKRKFVKIIEPES